MQSYHSPNEIFSKSIKSLHDSKSTDTESAQELKTLLNKISHISTLYKDLEGPKELFSVAKIFNETIIHFARKGYHETVKVLLQAKVNPDTVGKDGYDALSSACLGQQLTCMAILLKEADDYSKERALMLTAKRNLPIALNHLLNKKKYTNNALHAALSEACHYGHSKCVAALLKTPVTVHEKNNKNYPLSLAALAGSIECVTLLLDNMKMNPRSDAVRDLNYAPHASDCNYTPLQAAAIAGKVDILQLLLERKAMPTEQGPHSTPSLIFAAERGHTDCVKLLLDVGDDKHLSYEKTLWHAVHSYSEKVVSIFLNYNLYKQTINKDYLCNNGKSIRLLTAAIQPGRDAVVMLLINAKADINAPEDQTDCISAAICQSNENLVHSLLEAKAHVRAKTYSALKKTALTPQCKIRIFYQLLEENATIIYDENQNLDSIISQLEKVDLQDPAVSECINILSENKEIKAIDLPKYKKEFEELYASKDTQLVSANYLSSFGFFPEVISNLIYGYAPFIIFEKPSPDTIYSIRDFSIVSRNIKTQAEEIQKIKASQSNMAKK